MNYTEILKAITDKTRLRILRALIKSETGLCVCELMDVLNETQYNVSRHLRILRLTGLVRERKESKWVVYSVIEPAEKFVKCLFEAIESIPGEYFEEDEARLNLRLGLRKGGKCVVGLNSPVWKNALTKLKPKFKNI